MFDPNFLHDMRGQLEARLAHNLSELQALNNHIEIGRDSDENATEVNIDDTNRSLSERLKSENEQISAALARFDDGSYGLDIYTGEEISVDRLRAIPWATTNI